MKEQIRLILADIDGTLLNSSHEVTELTGKAIGKLKDRQYKIVVYKNSKEYTTLTIDYSSTLKGEYHITD